MNDIRLSSCIGFVLYVTIAMYTANYIALQFKTSYLIQIFLYVLIYVILVYLYEKVLILIVNSASLKKYNVAKLLIALIFIFDVQTNMKRYKIVSLFASNNNTEEIFKYFDDKNTDISIFAMLLYSRLISKQDVLNWFEKKYTENNIQIPSEYSNIYNYLKSDIKDV